MTDAYFLNWLANRLVNVYEESEYVDFVVRLRRIASEIDKGKTPWQKHAHESEPKEENAGTDKNLGSD